MPARLAAGGIAALVMLSTSADVLMPVYAGKLVDAVALGAGEREAARDAAVHAFAVILLLGAAIVVLRHLAFLGVIRLTLGTMADVATGAFHCVQRFSTEWHAILLTTVIRRAGSPDFRSSHAVGLRAT